MILELARAETIVLEVIVPEPSTKALTLFRSIPG